MVLEQLKDGASWQMLDLDEGTRRLIFILCLPLLDGVFATLLVTGAVSTFSDFVAIALTIFSGAGAIAVLASYSETRAQARKMVYKASVALLIGATAIALVAPIYEQLFYVERLQYAAGLALLIIAAQLADIEYADVLSTPAVILTGLVLSVRSPGALTFSFSYMAPALATALIASLALYGATFLVTRDLTMSYVRRGSAVVLTLIALSMFGVELPSELGLSVFAASMAASLEPTDFKFNVRRVLKSFRNVKH